MPTYTIFANSDEKASTCQATDDASSTAFTVARTGNTGSGATIFNYNLNSTFPDIAVGYGRATFKGGAPYTWSIIELFLKFDVSTPAAANEVPSTLSITVYPVTQIASPMLPSRFYYTKWSDQTWPYFAINTVLSAAPAAATLSTGWSATGSLQTVTGTNVNSANIYNGPGGNTLELCYAGGAIVSGVTPVDSSTATIRTSYAAGTTQDPFITLVTTAGAAANKYGWGVLL